MKRALFLLYTSLFLSITANAAPWQASGFKVGEVTDTKAIVWTRLTANAKRVHRPGVLPIIYYKNVKTGKVLLKPDDGRSDWIVADTDNSVSNKDTLYSPIPKYPEGETIETVDGAAPGTSGEVRVLYKASTATKWRQK